MNDNTVLTKNQKREYHLKQARKYRLALLTITHAKVRADYLAKAESHEQIAHDLLATVEDSPPTLPPPTPPPKENTPPPSPPPPPKEKSQDITPPHFIKVHSKLAPLVLKTKDANLIRAFSIWLVLRSTGKTWFYQEQVIKMVQQRTGKDQRTIQRWLSSGGGIFWVKGWRKGKRTISLRGKNKVLDTYGLTVPGRVLAVPMGDLLTPKLKHLRACLRNVFFNREKKWASRETIEKETGISPRTQYNYDKDSDITPIPMLAYWPWVDSRGKQHRVKSLPNRYLQKYGNTYKQHKTKRFNLRTVGNNAIKDPKGKAVKVDKAKGRLLFDTVNHAADKAAKMAKKGIEGVTFGIMGKSKRRAITMVKVIIPEYVHKAFEGVT